MGAGWDSFRFWSALAAAFHIAAAAAFPVMLLADVVTRSCTPTTAT